jgi:hypothetical protein
VTTLATLALRCFTRYIDQWHRGRLIRYQAAHVLSAINREVTQPESSELYPPHGRSEITTAISGVGGIPESVDPWLKVRPPPDMSTAIRDHSRSLEQPSYGATELRSNRATEQPSYGATELRSKVRQRQTGGHLRSTTLLATRTFYADSLTPLPDDATQSIDLNTY